MALPLLHKYVLSPEDDKDLTLAKLRYRLCVKEVCEVLINRAQERGVESPQQTTATTDDDSFHLNPILRWEDSGIGTDESVSEDLRSPQHHDVTMTTEEPSITNDISRQPDFISDENFHPEASAFLSSSSTSSDSCDESEEAGKPYLFSRNGENFDDGENAGDRGFFENVNTEEVEDDVALTHVSSCLGNQDEDLHEEDEEMEKAVFVPVMSSTLDSRMDASTDDKSPLDEDPPDWTVQRRGNDNSISSKGINDKCVDVNEALRILMTHKELPQIIARKPAVTWASWNVADTAREPQRASWNVGDITREPQKVQTEDKDQQESQGKRNSSYQLRATHERIMSKDKKLADIYRKIKERDEEDQRMVKELLKKQTIPFAEPLPIAKPIPDTKPIPAALPPKPAVEPIEPSRPQIEKEKEAVRDAKPSRSDSSARKTLPRAEEPVRKKKNGNVFQNVVHSLQRRFSKRGNRETTTAS